MLDAQELAYLEQKAIESIQRISDEQLPWPEVREALIARIRAGETIYAYGISSMMMIFHEQPKIYMQQHFTPEEWARAYGFLDGEEGA